MIRQSFGIPKLRKRNDIVFEDALHSAYVYGGDKKKPASPLTGSGELGKT